LANVTSGRSFTSLPVIFFITDLITLPHILQLTPKDKSSIKIANEIINESNSENTLQFDGTSKWGEHFFTFDISTPERSFTGSILDLDIENSKTQLEATKSMFSELSEIFNGLSGNPEEINCTLSKMVKTIHNTMSDRGPTNKPYIHLFQKW
jgi:hypothetical protein